MGNIETPSTLSVIELEFRDTAECEMAETVFKRSREHVRKFLKSTIRALVSTVELKDPYTAGHQRRVAKLACAIAEDMGLSEEEIDNLRMAGFIHDLGKLSIPTEILTKPNRLKDNEFGIIRAHPQIGYDILKDIEFSGPVALIALQHHERMDGSGYPFGLSGKDILMESRIIAVADVVEAMSSHRPYRPANGINMALEEIAEKSNALYDPAVVDACLRVFNEKGFEFQ